MSNNLELAKYKLNDEGQLLEGSHESIERIKLGQAVYDLISPSLEEVQIVESNNVDIYALDALSESGSNLNKVLNGAIEEEIAKYAELDREDKDLAEEKLGELISVKRLINGRSNLVESGFRFVIAII